MVKIICGIMIVSAIIISSFLLFIIYAWLMIKSHCEIIEDLGMVDWR